MIHLRQSLWKLVQDPISIKRLHFISLSSLFEPNKKIERPSVLKAPHCYTAPSPGPNNKQVYYSTWSQGSSTHSSSEPTNIDFKTNLLDSETIEYHLALLHRFRPWRWIINKLIVRHRSHHRHPQDICLLPNHPLVIIALNLIHVGISHRTIALLDQIDQDATRLPGILFFSPESLEVLVDATVQWEAWKVLPSLVRTLSRIQSTLGPSQRHHAPLITRLSDVYAKLMNAYYIMEDYSSALAIYSSAVRNSVPCNALMYKRAIQSLFKRFIPSPSSDVRRLSYPRRFDAVDTSRAAPLPTNPPIDAVFGQLKGILDRMASDNIPPSSRMLADIFRGLGSILKLETRGVELEHNPIPPGSTRLGTMPPGYQNPSPNFRLDRLVLDNEIWEYVGGVIISTLSETSDSTDRRQIGSEGQKFILMAWADVMLSLREDVADAIVRTLMTKAELKVLSNRINRFLGADHAWNYQRTFDRLAKMSSLRPHHVNSHGSPWTESDPALDLPAGPAPDQWPISRTLAEAQRISLLIRDRLVEGDSLAALLQFHSLASLCATFRRLCDTHDLKDAPSLVAQAPKEGVSQRPPEAVLTETRHELDVRVESVYIRLAGHALRTGDSGYVNDVLELSYTLPPRRDKLTFTRVWKRAMGAFVSWRSDWDGSAGIGRAFKTLAHLLGIGLGSAAIQAPTTGAIDQARPRAHTQGGSDRNLFDLSWLRERHTWPRLGRNVFPRASVVSVLLDKAEQSTSLHLRSDTIPNRKMGAKHLQDAYWAAKEAETRRTIRWLRENHPRYMSRLGDPSPSLAELDALERAEARSPHTREWDKRPTSVGFIDIPATTTFAKVLCGLSIPLSTGEAQRIGYLGPTYKESTKDPKLPQGVEG